MDYSDVIDFWFSELQPKQWWEKDFDLDSLIEARFKKTLIRASNCELFGWRKNPKGRLAEIIVLDQFSRNIFRGKPESFKQDSLALCLAQEAVFLEADENLNESEKAFLYMPYMHSESKLIHKEAVKLFEKAPKNMDFELKHKRIIDRFGRYPHRNKILGRDSTPEEVAFLNEPGSSF